MKRIASLSILFAVLIEFVIGRARFDLWIMTVAIVTLFVESLGTSATLSRGLAEARPQRLPF
jgi:hypothetical protein